MWRLAAVTFSIVACAFGGIGGAFVGMGAPLGFPLSEANFENAIGWGLRVGLFGGAVTATVLTAVPQEKLLLVGLWGVTITTALGSASLWWVVVSSLR